MKCIKLSVNNDKENFVHNKNSLSDILKIKDFKEGLIIKEKEKNMIVSSKIKNKKELNILSFEQNSILEKTVELNKNGFFYNVKSINNIGESLLVSTYNIPKNTFLTIIGGEVYYKKNFIKSSK